MELISEPVAYAYDKTVAIILVLIMAPSSSFPFIFFAVLACFIFCWHMNELNVINGYNEGKKSMPKTRRLNCLEDFCNRVWIGALSQHEE